MGKKKIEIQKQVEEIYSNRFIGFESVEKAQLITEIISILSNADYLTVSCAQSILSDAIKILPIITLI